MTSIRAHIAAVTEAVLCNYKIRKATKFVSPRFVVCCTRQRKPRRGERSCSYVLTIGQPNFRGREFVKACQKAGEPFPVKNVQLKLYP